MKVSQCVCVCVYLQGLYGVKQGDLGFKASYHKTDTYIYIYTHTHSARVCCD